MDNPAALASAVAATLAAVFGGLNLYLSGRRDRVKWVRESAADTFVEFLTASYDHRAACRQLRTLPHRSPSLDGYPALVERIANAEDVMMKGLSRLRMLASPEAVEVAIRLHSCNDRYHDMATGDPNEDMTEQMAATDQAFRTERDRLVRTAKTVLSLI